MPDATIDITHEVCPMTYVRVKLAMEALSDGATLEVILKGREPLKNVPLSLKEEGHELLSLDPLEGGRARLTLRVRRS